MAKKRYVFLTTEEVVKQLDLDLKNRGLAALLAWLVPGLGHFYQGRNAKGAIFMGCIVTLLVFGIYVGQGNGETTLPDDPLINVAYAPTESMALPNSIPKLMQFVQNHWKFVCESGIGAVALPSLVERHRVLTDRPALLGGLFRPPRMAPYEFISKDIMGNTVNHPNQLAKWNYDSGFYYELGTVYAVVAGLLNVIVIYDAARGPLLAAQDSDSKEPDSAGSTES
ncbi:MAG: hypothetical protein KDA37_04640 [Planctomycetales bacterium]|nr:hypothetical protein [Planctomycetales bacterium]